MTFCVRLYCSLLVMRPPPRSTLFPTRRSSDLALDFLQVLRREMKSGGVLQQKRAELAGVGQWQDAGAKFIEVALIRRLDRKSTRLNSSHSQISYAVFCLTKKKNQSPRER